MAGRPGGPGTLDRAMSVTVLENLQIAMRDGILLEADVYLPAGAGPFPVLLERTPYGRRGTNAADRTRHEPEPRSKPQIATGLARAGYACVLQDCRGRYGSQGVFTKYLGEGADGADTMAWILAQSWCDGRIGTFGLSYGAHVQTALAALAPPGLGAMLLDSGGFSDAFRSGIRQGGAYELKQLTWAAKHARLDPATKRDPARRAALEREDVRCWLGVRPWREGHSPIAAAPEYEQFVLDQWRHERFDGFWRRDEFHAAGAWDRFPDVPVMLISSWYDPYARSAVENFTGLGARKQAPLHLVLGPWTHGQRSVTFAGDVDFGPDAPLDGALAQDYDALRQAFFDHHLRRLPCAPPLPAPVCYFLMGGGPGGRDGAGRLRHGGRWCQARTWPPEGTCETALFLQPAGLLAGAPPSGPARADWIHDPLHPVPTVGGAIASGAPVMTAGAFDQRERPDSFGSTCPGRALADRPDTVIFQTAPLDRPVAVAGRFRARLWVVSDAQDTDIAMTLIDVHPPQPGYPDGFAMNLAHGILRLRFRSGFDEPVPLRPGEPVEVLVEGFPTANLFLPGHRIRVQVASSNFPHFDVSPGVFAAAGADVEPQRVRNAILMGPDHPSRILLDVLQEGAA